LLRTKIVFLKIAVSSNLASLSLESVHWSINEFSAVLRENVSQNCDIT
jgi:hypothetical protein